MPEKLLTDQHAQGFTEGVTEERYAGWIRDEGECYDFILRNLPANSRVLDVGCGSGEFTLAMAREKGCRTLGVEPNAERAKAAKANGLEVINDYLTADLAQSNGKFDVVVFLDVLEHAADPVSILRIARLALRDGGVLLISVPNVAHWTIRLALIFGRFDYTTTGLMDATHLRWFTAETIARVVESAGFRVERQTVTRGTWLPAYGHAPWRLLRQRASRNLIRIGCRFSPGLFGCQHVLKATVEL